MTGDKRRTGRVRLHDRTRDTNAFGHSPPLVIWHCRHQPTHRMLRVFQSPDGWHLLGDRMRVPLGDWLNRIGAEYSVDDVTDGRVVAMNAHRVQGLNRMLPLDIATWAVGDRFEVGCKCGTVWAELSWLAEDCRRARDTRTQVARPLDL